ncbi:MAG: nucleoside kinase [Candidatus Methanomethylophilaceae archaeon]|nr:nucleoside kinase [Candidatus Methanomethylophilaceae archaeon]
MKPFLTVYGHVSVDQIILLNEFPEVNSSVDILRKKRCLGGTGANIATLSAAMGAPTAISSCVGDDFPSKYREFMESKGLMTDELIAIAGWDTSMALIINDRSRDQMTCFFQGPLGNANPERAMTEMAENSDYVHISTGNPAYYLRVMALLERSGAKLVFDPAQETRRIWNREMFCAALEHADILFSNEYEIDAMLEYASVEDIKDLPVDLVLVTRGAAGSSVYIGGDEISVPAVKAKRVVDTTGAGDAYRAAFYNALYRGMSILDAAAAGAAAASFAVEEEGALTAIPSWEQVMERANL